MAKKLTVTGEKLTIKFPRQTDSTHGEVDIIAEEGTSIEVSDGHHTMREVYDHRYVIFMTLLRMLRDFEFPSQIWKSKLHSDGTMFDNSFICGIGETAGHQITYHLPLKYWNELPIPERDNAPIWDGHTAADTLDRLRAL